MEEGWPLVILYGLAVLTTGFLIIKNEYFPGRNDYDHRYSGREWD